MPGTDNLISELLDAAIGVFAALVPPSEYPEPGWRILDVKDGRLKLRNQALYRRSDLCHVVERELMGMIGVSSYSVLPSTSEVELAYDVEQATCSGVLAVLIALRLDEAGELDRPNLDLALCTASVPAAAVAQFAFPALLVPAGALFAYTALPSFRSAYRVLTEEKRLGVDLLDAIVIAGCLATGNIFPGAVLCWCLAFGRFLVRRTEDDAKRLLLSAFGKHPRTAWLVLTEEEAIEVPVSRLKIGDIVRVRAGEAVPVDGIVVYGVAMIDQSALTGESVPAEKEPGDEVFASTLMIKGEIGVRIERSGDDTATARIADILEKTASYTLSLQRRGEQLADLAVAPTLALGGLAAATLGTQGALATINSDLGTGIRMAAPLAMLSSLALCTREGILIKDGRALDALCRVDTIVFDKTGTLTMDRPIVESISGMFARKNILALAAAAESAFDHPIAQAIKVLAKDERVLVPKVAAATLAVGKGVLVEMRTGAFRGQRVSVGSVKFMGGPGNFGEKCEAIFSRGNAAILVAVDDTPVGVIEFRAHVRPEIQETIKGLRERGIEQIAIISGDHEAPTRRLAEELGIDRYFAGVLPTEKADHVARLQAEGRRVCFVGDGINDAVALWRADVGISLRGATSIATDSAQIVFMEPSLAKLCRLRDIACELDANVRQSWMMILIPNALCIAGVFTLGFGVGTSVVTNNVAGLAALGNGLRIGGSGVNFGAFAKIARDTWFEGIAYPVRALLEDSTK